MPGCCARSQADPAPRPENPEEALLPLSLAPFYLPSLASRSLAPGCAHTLGCLRGLRRAGPDGETWGRGVSGAAS